MIAKVSLLFSNTQKINKYKKVKIKLNLTFKIKYEKVYKRKPSLQEYYVN